MSPQPTATPTAGEQTMAERQIARAHALERQRKELQDVIAANRDLLRLMAKGGELNAAQQKWLKTFYPEKEKNQRRSEEELEATRQAKLAALKSQQQ